MYRNEELFTAFTSILLVISVFMWIILSVHWCLQTLEFLFSNKFCPLPYLTTYFLILSLFKLQFLHHFNFTVCTLCHLLPFISQFLLLLQIFEPVGILSLLSLFYFHCPWSFWCLTFLPSLNSIVIMIIIALYIVLNCFLVPIHFNIQRGGKKHHHTYCGFTLNS